MLQPSKMQGEARNCKNRRFGALRAQLCALRAQDQLENLTNCPLLLATHSDFYASTLKNSRGSQKLRKQAFLCASRAIARAARALSQNKPRRYRRLTQTDLQSNFRRPATIFTTNCPKHRFERRRPPRCLPSPKGAQKGNLLASLGG